MIFTTPSDTQALTRDLAELDSLRERLGSEAGVAGPWLGSLRRQWRAASAESSIEIEGFRVPRGERIGVASGEVPMDPDDEDRMALSCYARAMDHVGVMSTDPVFHWLDRVILDLHFDACYFQKDKDPGRYRTGGNEVTNPRGGPPAYVGPPAEDVADLMREVVDWLGRVARIPTSRFAPPWPTCTWCRCIRFATVMVESPRIVQSLVLARGGLLAPEFLSIEEYLGRNTDAYYAALQKVQGGRYQPDRDASPWVRFCVRAHIEQARDRLRQLAEAGDRWSVLEELVETRSWPDRLVVALEQSLFGGVDRASYAAEAEISPATASNDLRRLLDGGLVVQEGSGRTTRYVASDNVRAKLEGLSG